MAVLIGLCLGFKERGFSCMEQAARNQLEKNQIPDMDFPSGFR